MEKRKDYNKFDSAFMFFASIVIVQAIVLLIYIIYALIATQIGVDLENFTTYTVVKYINTIIIQLIFLGIFFIYNKRKKIDFVQATKINKDLNLKSLLIIIVISIICLFGFLPLINVFDHILELIGVNLTEGLSIPLNNFWQFSLAVLFMAVLPAIAEELIFRGIIFNGLLKVSTPKKAIILSAVIFCIMHLSVQQTVYQLILGVVLALLVYYTGSLLASIVAHFINNFIVVLYNYISTTSETLEFNSFWSYFVPILIAGIVLIILFFLFRTLKHINERNAKQEKEQINFDKQNTFVENNEGSNNVLFNPDVIFVCTFIIAMLIWTTSFFN